VLLIAAGAAGAFAYFNRATPEKTLDTYCQALQAQNYVAAYNQLATSLQNMETEPQYAAILQALGKTTSCKHGSANIITNTATASLTLVTAGHTYNGTVTLLQDSNNNWKISILLSSPEMTMNTFCNALAIGDYQTAYSALSSDLKSQNSESQFETDFAGFTCSYSGINVVGINAAANAVFTSHITGTSAPAIVTLIEDHNSNNDWKINSIQ
jgi:limonene-1,2-epoxide hydrolase